MLENSSKPQFSALCGVPLPRLETDSGPRFELDKVLFAATHSRDSAEILVIESFSKAHKDS